MVQIIKITLCCLVIFFNPFFASAQDDCSTHPTEEQIKYLSQNVEERMHFRGAQDRSSGIRWVPIQFHECVHSPGSVPTVYQITHIDMLMSKLNAVFLPYDIQFFECGPINVFANSTLHSFDNSEEAQLVQYETPNVLNVYFFAAVTSGGTPVCGYSYLPPSADRIIMRKSCLYDEVFLHEIGHYFSLYHTHGNNATTDELVNGSNCQVAGDDICDTPADPNLFRAYGYMNGCTYIGQVNDVNGDRYVPDPTNLMSYAHIGCKTQFSTQQKNRMAYSVLNDRAYLTGCQHPNACSNPITSLPYHADFETGLENWSNIYLNPGTQAYYQIGSGATPTVGTGPDAAFSGSQYAFVESNNQHINYRVDVLRGPCFDLRGYTNPKLSYRYHSFGSSILEHGVAFSTDGGYDWVGPTGSQIIHYATDNNSNQWNQVVCNLSAAKTARYFQLGFFASLGVDSLGDFAIDSIRIFDDTPTACNLAVIGNVLNVTCTGLNNGSIALSVSGNNTNNITYLWSNGGTSGSITGLAPGTYTVTVSNGPGCTNVQTFSILTPQPLVLSATTAHTGGATGGSVTTTVSGGTTPYTYAWSNGSSAANLSGVAAGTYGLTVTDSKDCSTTGSYLITQPVVCSTYYSAFPWTSSLEANFGIFERVNGYQTNWVRRSGATANPNTGPDQAYNGSQYAFINSGNTQRTAVLQSKDCLNLLAVNNPVFEFYYHLFGAQMGTLHVEISTNNGTTWTTVWSLSGNQGNQWQKASINLQPYNNGATRIRLRGVAISNTSDMAVDAFYIGPAGGNQYAPFESTEQGPTLSVSPNPSNGIFNLKVAQSAGFERFEVLNASGQIITEQVITDPLTRIDLSAQPTGLYYLRAYNNEVVEIRKILITK
jgi:hypothetical protein